MAHYWIDENKKYGFYLLGFFDKGKKAKFGIQKEKPFEVDLIEGVVEPQCICCVPYNVWPKEWAFIEGRRIKEIDLDEYLRKLINEIWSDWCKKYNRKYEAIMIIEEQGEKVKRKPKRYIFNPELRKEIEKIPKKNKEE